jgi:hypothetical protein
VDVGKMKKMTVTAVASKAKATCAAETKAENKQKQESRRKLRPGASSLPGLGLISFILG